MKEVKTIKSLHSSSLKNTETEKYVPVISVVMEVSSDNSIVTAILSLREEAPAFLKRT